MSNGVYVCGQCGDVGSDCTQHSCVAVSRGSESLEKALSDLRRIKIEHDCEKYGACSWCGYQWAVEDVADRIGTAIAELKR
jgi:hypothetical protein